MNKERKTLAVTSIFGGKTILKPLEADVSVVVSSGVSSF
jgi:hypothetical protein